MNIVDAGILIVIAGVALFGLWRGFVIAVGAMVASAVGSFVSSRFSESLAPTFAGVMEGPGAAKAIAGVVLFLVAFIACNAVAMIVSRMLQRMKLGWLDRTLGFLLGAVAGFLMAGTALVLVATYLGGAPQSAPVRESRVAFATIEAIRMGKPAMPQVVADGVERTYAWLKGGSPDSQGGGSAGTGLPRK